MHRIKDRIVTICGESRGRTDRKKPKNPIRLRNQKDTGKKGMALLSGDTYLRLAFFFGSSFAIDIRSMM